MQKTHSEIACGRQGPEPARTLTRRSTKKRLHTTYFVCSPVKTYSIFYYLELDDDFELESDEESDDLSLFT